MIYLLFCLKKFPMAFRTRSKLLTKAHRFFCDFILLSLILCCTTFSSYYRPALMTFLFLEGVKFFPESGAFPFYL